MGPKTFQRTAVGLALAGTFALIVGTAEHLAADRGNAAAQTPVPVPSATIPTAPPTTSIHAAPAAALPDFSELVEKYGPAVVNIDVVQGTKTSARVPRLQGQDGEDLAPFFRHFPFQFQFPQPGPMRGLGSGFIVSPDGIILTNAHVVADADEVTVRLTDKREFKAKVLGSDKTTDIAVLKIDARNLPTVKAGDPSRIRVGEWVVAIGSQYGFENTVTSGIVSAKARTLPDESYVPFIQTDAAVNPGSSGGPLFNLRGEVIGITSQIFSRSGGYQGLAFAIPIDVAMQVKDQIQQHGKVSHGLLGVSVQEVNSALASNFGLKSPVGALVSSVQKGGPAAKAGIQPGDVIIKFNGRDINRSSELPPLVAALQPGSTATLEVWRNGGPKQLSVTVGKLEDKTTVASNDKEDTGKGLGIAVRALTAQEKRDNDLPSGVVVQDVAGSGPAARAGVQPGDVIVAVNNTPVNSVEQLRDLVKKSGKTMALPVQREDARIFIPVTVG